MNIDPTKIPLAQTTCQSLARTWQRTAAALKFNDMGAFASNLAGCRNLWHTLHELLGQEASADVTITAIPASSAPTSASTTNSNLPPDLAAQLNSLEAAICRCVLGGKELEQKTQLQLLALLGACQVMRMSPEKAAADNKAMWAVAEAADGLLTQSAQVANLGHGDLLGTIRGGEGAARQAAMRADEAKS